MNKLHRALWSDVAVDLGTVNTPVHMTGRGVVLDEPSVLAVDPLRGVLRGLATWLDQGGQRNHPAPRRYAA